MNTWKMTAGRCLWFGLALAVLAVPAYARRNQTNAKDQTTSETKQIDTEVFTGTIQSVDLQLHTVTVMGHEVRRTETIKHTGKTAGQKPNPPKKADAKKSPATTNSTRTFRLDPMCKIVTTTNPGALAADLKVGQAVDVAFHVMSDNVAVADSITPPQSTSEK
jgi:Tfp pilus assembly protein FimT